MAEIRCSLKAEGDFKDTRYTIRYFQPDGKGELRLEDGTLLVPNDRYWLPRKEFRLYYTSHSTDRQTMWKTISGRPSSYRSTSTTEKNEDTPKAIEKVPIRQRTLPRQSYLFACF